MTLLTPRHYVEIWQTLDPKFIRMLLSLETDSTSEKSTTPLPQTTTKATQTMVTCPMCGRITSLPENSLPPEAASNPTCGND